MSSFGLVQREEMNDFDSYMDDRELQQFLCQQVSSPIKLLCHEYTFIQSLKIHILKFVTYLIL